MIISHPNRIIADLSADLKSLLNSLFFRRFDGNSDRAVADPDKAALVAVITMIDFPALKSIISHAG